MIIAVCVTIMQTIFVLMVSYALSRMRFKGRELLMRFWLILGMFPGFLTMICLYFLLKQFGLTQAGAIPGLILIGFASSGMGYYVCKGYFDTIPKSLDEAARIDGANRFQVFTIMLIPLSCRLSFTQRWLHLWHHGAIISLLPTLLLVIPDSYNVAVCYVPLGYDQRLSGLFHKILCRWSFGSSTDYNSVHVLAEVLM